jgi:hypothetical protein
VLARPERTVLVIGHSLATAYLLGALEGRAPERTVPLVAYAHPYRLGADELERAIEHLEAWSAAPTW